ncbi:hypothetical protein H9X96_00240 [Pedobacter sp. N36a]|uniref:hypothetical protein n=1 Tax=Pedobacter sp. N36a TaxID=2767996 RepID=UPI00165760C2|nr:hypothetical protein [Pedobacter sp. N36a]MBC8984199.1 hypothetical protein [Pedobacter sp. N36a]
MSSYLIRPGHSITCSSNFATELAAATEAKITILTVDENVYIVIIDNGKGFHKSVNESGIRGIILTGLLDNDTSGIKFK